MSKDEESRILERLAEFAGQVVVIVEKMKDVVERFAADRYEELEKAAKEIDRLESRADDNKEAILDELAVESASPRSGRPGPAGRLHGQHRQSGHGRRGPHLDAQVLAAAAMNKQLVKLATIDVEAVQVLRDAVVAMVATCVCPWSWPGGWTRSRVAPTTSTPSSTRACTSSTPTTRPSTSSRPSSSAWRTWPTAAARTPRPCATWLWST